MNILQQPRASNIQITNYASQFVKKLVDIIHDSDQLYPSAWLQEMIQSWDDLGDTRYDEFIDYVESQFGGSETDEADIITIAIPAVVADRREHNLGWWSDKVVVDKLHRAVVDYIVALRNNIPPVRDDGKRRLPQTERKLQRVLEQTIYDQIDIHVEEILQRSRYEIRDVKPRGKIDRDLMYRITSDANAAAHSMFQFITEMRHDDEEQIERAYLDADSYSNIVQGQYDGDDLLAAIRNILITRLREIIPWWKPTNDFRLRYIESMSPADCSTVITDITTMLAFRRSGHSSDNKSGGPW